MGRRKGKDYEAIVISIYEMLLSENKIEPDGPAYSRLQKLKLDKLMRSKYGSYYNRRSKRLHGTILRKDEK